MSTSGRSAAYSRTRSLHACLNGIARVLEGASAGCRVAHDLASGAADADYHQGDRDEFLAATWRIAEAIKRLEELRARIEDEAGVARRNEERAASDL